MGEITVNMDFPMTADVASSSQSSSKTDFLDSTQSTDKSSFSNLLKGESNTQNSNPVSERQTSTDSKTDTPANKAETASTKETGNDLPEEGNTVPQDEPTTKLSKEEQKLLESLAEQGDPLAKALLQAQTEDGSIPLSALEALKKSIAPADAETTAAKTLDLLQARAATSQTTAGITDKTASTGSQLGTNDNRNLPLNTSDPDAAINQPKTAKNETEMNLQQMLEKRLSDLNGKTTSVNQNSNGTAQVVELPRALANQPTTTTPTIPQTAVSIRQPGWDQALTNSVQWMMKENLQEANIRVRPAELGPISVKVSMSGEQLSLNFNAAHAATREALESAMPRLREALAASGMDLGNVDVSDQGLAKQFQQQEFSENSETAQSLWQSGEETLADNAETEIMTTPLPQHGTGAVDIFA